MFFLLYQNATICDMAYYFRMMTERNTICIGQRLYRTEVSRSTEVAAPSNNIIFYLFIYDFQIPGFN